MSAASVVIGLVAAQRAAELAFAAGNARALRARGGIEIDAAGYPAFIVLHALWLGAIAVAVPASTLPVWPLLGLFGVLQLARLWVIASLGRRWTTRLIVVPGAAPVRAGPYRWCRHPNYAIVALEIPLLPLAFGAIGIAVACSAANLLLLARRIRIENAALYPAAAPPQALRSAGSGAGLQG